MAGTPGRDPWGTPGICYLFGSLLAGLLFPGAAAFNLDVMGALRKEGEPGSLFGFSVALHRQLQPRPQSWLLVGAPQALALPGQQANRTGGLFACPLSLEETDCYRVDIDQGADVQKESKENQWLGVSVRSQGPGGKIVTCAHRYEARQRVDQILETRDVIGRCFVLSQDLAIRDELDGGEWKFCEGRPQGHEQFGFCQQGTAAAFSPDSHYLLFGAPGTYNWKGTARVELCVQGSADLAHLDDGPYEAGGEKEQDPRLIPVPANSYFGRDPSPARSHSNPLLLSLVPPSTLPSFCLCLSVSLVLFLPLPLLPSCCSVCLCLRTLWPVLWMSLPWCLPAPPPQGCSL